VIRLRHVSELSDFRYLVVPHTHWDREWYLPFEVFRLRLGSVVDGVLDTLERDPSFTSFTLDGQAIVLEDYLEVRPENERPLQALLDAGRLEVGPSYVLPDEILVGGESLVRNLLLGRRVCRRFGVEPSDAGYLPDSFGHPAQLPQILAGFGIRTFLFSRGMGDEIDDVGVVFRWRAGPAEVIACQMLPHYDNFARVTWHDDAEERVQGIVERFGELLRGAGQDEIVLANGSDHLPVEPELPEILSGLERTLGAEFRIGRYDEYAPTAEGLPVHSGELVGSRLQNILRGVNSARVYLKQANERAERRLLSIETAAALRSLREEVPYSGADLRLAWRDLLGNHPHDSICGCSCDEVHRDMLVRYEQLDRTLDYVEREALGVGGALVNTLPFRRRRVVDGKLYELEGFTGVRADPIRAGGRSTGSTRSSSFSSSRMSPTSATCTRSAQPAKCGQPSSSRLAPSEVRSCSNTSCRGFGSRRRSAVFLSGASSSRASSRTRRTITDCASSSAPTRALMRCVPRASSPWCGGRSRHGLRGQTGSSRRCQQRTRSARSRSGHSSSSRRASPSTRRHARACG
jgi:hypothetical protein